MWEEVSRAFSGETEFIFPDISGCQSVAEMADQALDVVSGAFTLLGYSMGGYAALETLRRAPERVNAAVLISTSARADTDEAKAWRQKTIDRTSPDNFRKFLDSVIDLCLPHDRRDESTLRTIIEKMAQDVGVETLISHQTAIRDRPNSVADLNQISCPVLVVVGEEDRVTPPEHAREIVGSVANATLRVIPRCGHMPGIEKPHELTAILKEWFADPDA